MRNKNLRSKDPSALLIPLALLIISASCRGSQPETQVEDSGEAGSTTAESINSEVLRTHVASLSSDEMAGRGPGSSGARLAREYLSETLTGFGLEPAFSGSWEQRFDLVGITSSAPETWRFAGTEGSLEIDFGQDFIANSGVQAERAEIVDAELVFVGFGIEAAEYDWDDYKGYDLEGKVLVMLNNDPDWDDALFEGHKRLYYGRWDYKYEKAADQGAAAAILIHTTPSAGYPWQVVQTSWTGAQFELPAAGEPRVLITTWVTEDAARRLVSLAGRDLDELVAAARSRDFKPLPLGITTSLSVTSELERVEGVNVGGLLRGSDPVLREEVVVFTAHHDHLGQGAPNEDGDRIYNGARDNASGSAAVLAIAQAFSRLTTPPARSLLFLFVDAEEQGLLGSEYFARNPTFEPGRIAANINIDGANIWGRTRDLALIGYGKSSLDSVVEEVAARQGRTVKPEQFPDKGHFYRSDQFNFAKIGVPAIYTDNGIDFIDRPVGWGREQIDAWVDTHYHQPSDELNGSWNFDGFVEDTLLLYDAGRRIADDPELPAWNPGDEFEGARLEALAALR